MKHEIKIPAVGESITEATISDWTKQNGEAVKRNDVILLLETDKASVEVVAEHDGVLQIKVEKGQVVPIGSVVGHLDTEGKASASATPSANGASNGQAKTPPPPPGAPPPSPAHMPSAGRTIHPDLQSHLSPAVQKVVSERNLDPSQITGTGKDGRLTKQDVVNAPASTPPRSTPTAAPATPTAPQAKAPPSTGNIPPVNVARQRTQQRAAMTTIRKRIAERLVQSQQTTATLTTFNEIDMTRVMELRSRHKDRFKEKYGVNLGFMGFFIRAAVEALRAVPAVNGFIEGSDIVYNHYCHIGVAVGTDRGLIVPVIRDADLMSIAQIEGTIRDYAIKARDSKILVDDLMGGTFTISNGGVYGSLMSTPILNPPQSGILGMHKIEERPIVINGKIEIRPMMYIALSYDHRIIDGKEAVTFLVKVKEGVEDPERLLLEV